MRRLAVLALAIAAPAGAAPLVVARANAVVADGVSTANPKAIPGASVDTTLVVTNPATNLGATVAAVAVVETLPAGVKLRVADLAAAGGGPVEFTDGNLLGLVRSGLSLAFASLASTADGVDFSIDGTNWGYVPVADAGGCDPQVRAIRVRLTGSQVAASGFRLRYRVVVK